MSERKLQFWLRPDQRANLVRCLSHCRTEFRSKLNRSPDMIDVAGFNIACDTVSELLSVFAPEPTP